MRKPLEGLAVSLSLTHTAIVDFRIKNQAKSHVWGGYIEVGNSNQIMTN